MAAFTYMGTKRGLAPSIALLCKSLPDGPFLDLFSGISAAGMSLSSDRNIWCNDVQVFSYTLTEALYRSSEPHKRLQQVISVLKQLFDDHRSLLAAELPQWTDRERRALDGSDGGSAISLNAEIASEAHLLRAAMRGSGLHCLFTTAYAGTYYGLQQAIDIDSIRFAADRARESLMITSDEHRWSVLALCRAAAAASNSTGHFAQYLTPKLGNTKRFLEKRRRDVWREWEAAFLEMRPIGDRQWRKRNKVYRGDAVSILKKVSSQRVRPAIVYADPPYTSDQYSRYYHLLETLVLYDYPLAEAKGLYRPDRFVSKFSLKRTVDDEFRQLIEAAADVGSSMMISYPSNGLLESATTRIPELLTKRYKTVRDPIVIEYKHSTMGGSKGRQKEAVEECIFIAE